MSLEAEYGITYADLGIDVSRCRGAGECKALCPACHHTHSPGKQDQRDMRVNLSIGKGTCHRCGYAFSLENEAYKRNGWKDAVSPRTQIQGSPRHETRQNGSAYHNGGTNVSQAVNFNANPAPQIVAATPVAESELPDGLTAFALDWFRDRGISRETIDAFGITANEWTDAAGTPQKQINFPYRVDGALVNVKTRRLPKTFGQTKGAAKSLFNVDAAEGRETVVITEGEIDALSLHEAGWVAVSLQDGAPGATIDPNTGEKRVGNPGKKLDGLYEAKAARVLAAAKRIVLATDDDLEGRALKAALIERLKPERCWEVTYPDGCKDSSDVLMAHGAAALDRVIGSARPVDLPGVADFMTEYAALENIYLHGYDTGVETGWSELDAYFRPRRGTVTVMTGIPGNGKTSFTFALFSNLAIMHDWKFGIFSPESGDAGTLFGKLVQIASDAPVLPCDNQMSREQLRASAQWVANHFWRVDAARHDEDGYQVVTLPEIIARLEALVLRHGITAAIIDPWNRLEASRNKNQTETEYVAWAVNMLSRFAQRHNVAVFVVAHPHKMDGGSAGEEEKMPSPYQIAGSSHWYNMADTILGIQRNKWTEPLNRTTVRVWKNREEGVSGGLGIVYFSYDGRTRRYYADSQQIPVNTGTAPFVLPTPVAAQEVGAVDDDGAF